MMKQRRTGLFLFVCSCTPGCGQMYQGYMKRGLSMMLLFWGCLSVIALLGLDVLIFLLVPIWLYAYFDSYNLHARMEQGGPDDDAFLFGVFEGDSEKFASLLRKRHSLFGWLLIGVGLYMLYDSLVRRVLNVLEYYFEVEYWFYNIFSHDIPRLALTFAIIALGVWFIRGPQKANPTDEIPVFVPPVSAPLTEEPPAEEKEEAEHGDE